MPSNYPNNTHKKPSLHLRRRLLQWGLVGGVLVGGGKFSEPWWSSFFQPSPSHTLYTYAGHPSGVSSVAWSPDGTRIASVGWDSTIQVWNAQNGQHLLTYRGHPDAATVSWSPDSTLLASAGSNFTTQVWNASTGQQLWTHQDNSTGTPSWGIVTWSPDGRQIATFGSDNSGSIQVRNALDGRLLLNYTGHPYAVSLAWSPDSTRIVSGGYNSSVQVWKARDGQKNWFYRLPDADEDSGYINAVAWSPDGTHIASGGSCPDILFGTNQGIQMWDASTGRKRMNYRGHDGRSDIWAIAWSPDGKHLASGATDKTVQVWSATNGKTSFTYEEHTDEVRTVAWSPDGTRIVSGGRDRFVRVWKVV